MVGSVPEPQNYPDSMEASSTEASMESREETPEELQERDTAQINLINAVSQHNLPYVQVENVNLGSDILCYIFN